MAKNFQGTELIDEIKKSDEIRDKTLHELTGALKELNDDIKTLITRFSET